MITPTDRPRLRGVIHHYAFMFSLLAGAALVVSAPTPKMLLGVSIYAGSLSALLGTSALYHRVTWSAPARRWMGRLDHSMISVLIAGTYTPFGMAAASGTLVSALMLPLWIAASAAITLHLFWYDAPKWLSAGLYVAMGWIGAPAMPVIGEQLGWTPMILLLAGGLLYSSGALIYARQHPNPVPGVFGYHEVFHSLVVLAALAHYVAVMLLLRTAA